MQARLHWEPRNKKAGAVLEEDVKRKDRGGHWEYRGGDWEYSPQGQADTESATAKQLDEAHPWVNPYPKPNSGHFWQPAL